MKLVYHMVFVRYPAQRRMLGLLGQNLREWREIVRLDGTYERYSGVSADDLFMCGGRADSKAVDLAKEKLEAVLPHVRTKVFERLDHFGIERTSPSEVAKAIGDYFQNLPPYPRVHRQTEAVKDHARRL